MNEKMKNYLSFGGGVNSTAALLIMKDEGIDFEAVYVWMPDHPETHEYILYLESKEIDITIILPQVKRKHLGKTFYNLYEFCYEQRIFPYRSHRWCTADYKVKQLQNYFQKPAFINLGIDWGEQHRARPAYVDGLENRFPLIEREINRQRCLDIIKAHGLEVPRKSGCFFCPFQSYAQWRELRRDYPDLFCKAFALETRSMERAREAGKPGNTLSSYKSLLEIVDQGQRHLWPDMDLPPCQCGL